MSWAPCQESYRFFGRVLQRGAHPKHSVSHCSPDSQRGRDVPDVGTRSHSLEDAIDREGISLYWTASVTFSSNFPTIRTVSCCQAKSPPWLSDPIYINEQCSKSNKILTVKTILSEIKIVNELSGESGAALLNKCHFGNKDINKKYMCRQSPDTCFDSTQFWSLVKLVFVFTSSIIHGITGLFSMST